LIRPGLAGFEVTGDKKIADAISKGHAYGKHVLGEGQFDGATPGEFADIIQNVMENPSVTRALSNGRTAYYDANSGLVVIVNPNASDFGTAFVPANPLQYFNGLK
jgi:filamentous hemagglutinin